MVRKADARPFSHGSGAGPRPSSRSRKFAPWQLHMAGGSAPYFWVEAHMRSISIVALAVALAAGQFAAIEIALAATAGPLQPGQTNAQADCPAAAPSGTADPSANSACGQAKFSWHIVEQHPGFWTLDQVAPGSSRNAADPQPAVLQPTAPQIADAPAPSGGPGCTSYPLPIVLNGQPQQATVIACPQANGSWQ